MKIIIAGGGKIGHSVAAILADEGHDITVIDRNSALITQTTSRKISARWKNCRIKGFIFLISTHLP